MKIVSYISCLLILVCCKSKTRSAVADTTTQTFTPYRINDDYQVIDTGFFDAHARTGTFAVVQGTDNRTDTIDKYVSMQNISNKSYLYLAITNTRPADQGTSPKAGYKNLIKADLGSYTMITGDKKEKITGLTTGFNDFFSSPRVIDHQICFWQLSKADKQGKMRFAAAAYNPANHHTTSYLINMGDLGTDESGYLPPPYLKNDTIYFDLGQHLMKLSKNFKRYK